MCCPLKYRFICFLHLSFFSYNKTKFSIFTLKRIFSASAILAYSLQCTSIWHSWKFPNNSLFNSIAMLQAYVSNLNSKTPNAVAKARFQKLSVKMKSVYFRCIWDSTPLQKLTATFSHPKLAQRVTNSNCCWWCYMFCFVFCYLTGLLFRIYRI